MDFEPHYLLWTCPEGYRDSEECKRSCILGGQYCVVRGGRGGGGWDAVARAHTTTSLHSCARAHACTRVRQTLMATYQTWGSRTGHLYTYPCSSMQSHALKCTHAHAFARMQPDPDGNLTKGYTGADVLDINIRTLCYFRVAARAGQPWLWWTFAYDLYKHCGTSRSRFTPDCAEKVGLAARAALLCCALHRFRKTEHESTATTRTLLCRALQYFGKTEHKSTATTRMLQNTFNNVLLCVVSCAAVLRQDGRV